MAFSAPRSFSGGNIGIDSLNPEFPSEKDRGGLSHIPPPAGFRHQRQRCNKDVFLRMASALKKTVPTPFCRRDTLANNGGVVTSARGTYHVRHGFCSCPAAMNGCNHRYHVSALRIATIADELETAPVVSRPALIAEIKAAWSRRFPGESLAAELMARFRVNYLEALAKE